VPSSLYAKKHDSPTGVIFRLSH